MHGFVTLHAEKIIDVLHAPFIGEIKKLNKINGHQLTEISGEDQFWFAAYDAILEDFSPSNPFFYKQLVKIAFSASAGISAAILYAVLSMSGVKRRKFTPVRNSIGKVVYNPNCVLRPGSKSWNEDEFCGHFLITGASGFGKTVAYKAMLASLLDNVPHLGGMVIDAKGDILPDLTKLMKNHGRENDLIVLDARNPMNFPDWKPVQRLNLIGDNEMG